MQKISRFWHDVFKVYHVERFFLLELVLIITASILTPVFEKPHLNANIHNFSDAVWWSIITVTSVGYGDKVPLSAGGKIIGSVLAVSGVILFGITISLFSFYFSEKRVNYDRKRNKQTLDNLCNKIENMEKKIDYLVKKD